ncbi:MAG TPA: response regulator [Accumulibacter sp.]|nr:response regulator [Accumulibacter sp.]HMW17633.1 response regulator [Accumulibacter sp.]HMX21733.1 response regulator [Accumulibacter sp.]HMY05503.1 response regulator [Accumulibacter sp.]HNC18296.1 response regulator [Accumulibacter sp.]
MGDNGHRIFIVDDADPARRLLKAAFEKAHEVETFDCAEACLARLPQCVPDVFILDVGLPGMDGYALCRQIRLTLPDTPVIFISALDDLASALQGYEAGGDDFVVKPYKLAEVKEKVAHALRGVEERAALEQRLNHSRVLNSQALSKLDEYGVLIDFLHRLPTMSTVDAVGQATLELLRAYSLDGAIQLRGNGPDLTVSTNDHDSPLQSAVIAHIRSMGRVVEFKTRAGFNFKHSTLLVNNLPVDDTERCAYLRGRLAIAAEVVDARLAELAAREKRQQLQAAIGRAMVLLSASVVRFRSENSAARAQCLQVSDELMKRLSQVVATLEMSERQEQAVQEVVAAGVQNFTPIFDFSGVMDGLLGDMANVLHQLQTPR